MLVHYGCLWEKNKKINMEWRGSQHAVSAEPPRKCRVPPCMATFLVPPAWDSLLLSSKTGCGFGTQRRREGGNKMKGVASNYQQLGREVSVQGKHLPRRPLPTTLPVRCGLCEWCGQWGGGGSGYVLLLNKNWNETKHFQLSPDPPGRAADLALPGQPQTLAAPIKEAFIYLFLQ